MGLTLSPALQSTAKPYLQRARQVMGWLHHVQGVPLEELSFRRLLPDSSRAGVELPFEFLQYLAEDRGASPNYELVHLRTMLQMAKFLYRKESRAEPAAGDKPYYDLAVVRELRKLANEAVKRAEMRLWAIYW